MCRQKQSLMDMPHQKPWVSLTHFVKLYPIAFKSYFSCFSPKQTKLNSALQKVQYIEVTCLSEWVKVTLLCPTLCDPLDYTVRGILQARILEWVAFPFSRVSSQPGDQTQVCPNWRWILHQLSHEGSPAILERISSPFSSRSFWPRNLTRVSCIEGDSLPTELWGNLLTYNICFSLSDLLHSV